MFSKGRVLNITKEDILNYISEGDILKYYLGISKIPCVINSPLRPDKNPSFGMYSLDNKKVYYKDFSTKDTGDTFMLFSKLWNLDMGETLNKIYNDILKNKISNNSNIEINKTEIFKKGKIIYNENIDLKCKIRQWQKHDLLYWEQYGISLDWLIFSNTYPISHIIIKKNNKKYVINADKYAYVYVEFKDKIESLKIYQPFNEKYKWSNKHDGSVWDLWQQLPKFGENLIITSSRKDALCIWENSGIPACSLQAESYLPKKHVIQELKDRFKNIYVLYDNDFDKEKNYGDIYGEELSKQFELIKLKLPDELKVKDTSDLCKTYGRKKVKEIINNLIKF